MTAALTPPRTPRRLGRRLLRSSLVDLLVGPHGVDRYLELIRPALTVREARAEVRGPSPDRAQRHPDPASQRRLARIPGRPVRPRRVSRSTASGAPAPTRRPAQHAPTAQLELTVTAHPEGLVSNHLRDAARPGHDRPSRQPPRRVRPSRPAARTPGADQRRQRRHPGDVDAPHPLRRGPRRRVRVRALRAHRGRLALRPEVRALARRHPGLRVAYRATRGRRPAPRLDAAALGARWRSSAARQPRCADRRR